MIENLMTVNVDKFIQGTLKRGVPGNYLAVVSSIDEELRLRDLLWEEIQKIAEDGNHVIEEIDYYQARFHHYEVCGADMENKRKPALLRRVPFGFYERGRTEKQTGPFRRNKYG